MEYEEKIQLSGLKKTPHRKAIIEVLTSAEQPISAKEIYDYLKIRNIDISLSTVYRALDKLGEQELVKKLNFVGEDSARYESVKKGHRHYLVCLTCKKKLAINTCPAREYQE